MVGPEKDAQKPKDRPRKPTVKKETVKDLDPKTRSEDVKGGSIAPTKAPWVSA